MYGVVAVILCTTSGEVVSALSLVSAPWCRADGLDARERREDTAEPPGKNQLW